MLCNKTIQQVTVLLLCWAGLFSCKAPRRSGGNQADLTKKTSVGYIDTPYGTLEIPYTPSPTGAPFMLHGDMGIRPAAIFSHERVGLYAVGVSDVGYLWPEGRVPYTFKVTDAEASSIGFESVDAYKAFMVSAMKVWEVDTAGVPTGWKFEEATENDVNLVEIVVDASFPGGYVTTVGRPHGPSQLAMGVNEMDVAIHEVGHAMGLWHEQMHPDRDKHLTINWQNIVEDAKWQYRAAPKSNGQSLAPYDTDSVMHYAPWSFSIGQDYCSKKFYKRLQTNPLYKECLKDFPTFDRRDGKLFIEGMRPSSGDYAGVRRLRALADESFINPATLLVTNASTVSDEPSLPPYVEIKPEGKVSYLQYVIVADEGVTDQPTTADTSDMPGSNTLGADANGNTSLNSSANTNGQSSADSIANASTGSNADTVGDAQDMTTGSGLLSIAAGSFIVPSETNTAMQGFLYEDKFYTSHLKPGPYTLIVTACTFPQLSTSAFAICGEERAVPFQVQEVSNANRQALHREFAELAMAWNSSYFKIFESLDEFHQRLQLCTASDRGDVVGAVLALRDQYKLRLDKQTILATLSEMRIANRGEWDYLYGTETGTGISLAPRFDLPTSRIDVPTRRIDTPTTRIDTPSTRIETPRIDLPSRLGTPSRIDGEITPGSRVEVPEGLNRGKPLNAGEVQGQLVREPRGFKNRAKDFFNRYGTKVLVGLSIAGIVAYASWLAIENAESPEYSSSEPFVVEQCGDAKEAESEFKKRVESIAKDIQQIEAKMKEVSQKLSAAPAAPAQ